MACLIFTPKEIKRLRLHNSDMKRSLLPLLAALALPATANTLSFEDKREICALYRAGQVSQEKTAAQLGLKKPSYRNVRFDSALIQYCEFYQGR